MFQLWYTQWFYQTNSTCWVKVSFLPHVNNILNFQKNLIIIKVHMTRFFTVVIHFLIVKLNVKESYIR